MGQTQVRETVEELDEAGAEPAQASEPGAQLAPQTSPEIAAEGLNGSSPAVYGYFDPPWTPGPLRRNEVMLRTEAGQG